MTESPQRVARVGDHLVGLELAEMPHALGHAGIIVGEPHRLGPVRTDRRAGQDEGELGVVKRTIGRVTPSRFDRRMMMLVANNQHLGRPTDRL